MAIRGRDHYTREDNAYYKPYLVEVIGIIIYDTVLGLSVLYECKLFADDLWILALGPLVVVSTRITRSELWLAFDEPMCLELTDRGRVTYT
jgi:hypothetical protein